MEKKELTVFTPQIIEPVEIQYLDLGEKYEKTKEEFVALIDSVKDIEVTEEYLTEATQIQKQVNAMWNEIETARKKYHNYIDDVFYRPVADKIESEIKIKFQEWENTFKKSKLEVEKTLLEERIKSISDWFNIVAAENNLEWLTLDHAMQYGNVKITRKNNKNDIAKNCNAFIEKVKSDITVLNDGYSDEEKAEYMKTFDMSIAIATIKARKQEIEDAKQVKEVKDTSLVADIPKQEPIKEQEPIVAQESDVLVRIWEVKGTKEQLIELAKYIKANNITYKVRKDLM